MLLQNNTPRAGLKQSRIVYFMYLAIDNPLQQSRTMSKVKITDSPSHNPMFQNHYIHVSFFVSMTPCLCVGMSLFSVVYYNVEIVISLVNISVGTLYKYISLCLKVITYELSL